LAEKESRIIQSLYLYSVSRFCDVISATKVLWPLTDEIGYSIMGDNYVTFTLWHEQSALSVLTLYKAVACILPLKGTVTETGGGSYIATIDK